jgi:hypothetical protein
MVDKQVRLNLNFPATGYRRRMFFNRFEIEMFEDQPLFRFGLARGGLHGPLLDSFSCIMPRIDLEANKDRLLDYLPQLDQISADKHIPWVPPFEPGVVEVVTTINLARAKDSAEISLGVYSMHAAVSASRSAGGKVVLETDPVALLRCQVTLQKSFLIKLSKFL